MKRITLTTTLLLAVFLLAAAAPAAAQRNQCPRIPSVSNDPLNRSYRAGDTVPAELLDPPFVWVDCPAPAFPSGAPRTERTRVVFLSVVVDENGAVLDARARGAIDPEGFYDAAVAAIRNWRTNRPVWRGLSVKASVAVDVRFARPQTPPAAAQPAPEPPPQPAAPPVEPPVETASQPAAVTPTPVEARSEPPAAPAAAPVPAAPVSAAPVPTPTPAPETPPVATPVETTPARIEPRRAPYTPTVPQARDTEAFKVEYYYKVRWGYADEFWQLFNRNHWPLLRRQIEMGRIIDVYAERPRYHATEDGRWDYRVTIVFRSAADAIAPFDSGPLERQLFTDLDRYRREEQRRFELLLAHWDVPIQVAPLAP